jgi:predicted TIM-barrel fold metal-dependent hydrolase
MRVSRHLLILVGTLTLAGVIAAEQTPTPVPQTPAAAGDGRQGRGGRGTQITIKPGEECPPGTTLTRPDTCQAPQFPPPSIVDYRPKSTLKTDVHLVPKAKFPAIDFHGHAQNRLNTPETLARMLGELDALNVRMMVAADNVSGANLQRVLATIKGSPQPDRVRVLTGVNFSNVGPGWAERAVAQLEADIKAGAVGIGEISKSLGLRTRKADGTLLKVDDPDLDPIWEAAARLNVPVFIHTAEPQEFFEPIDFHNERWLELSLFGDRRYPAGEFPRFEELMTQRDNVFRKHPKTRFVAAHLGWHGNDLGRLGRMLDTMPNVYTEMGAVLYDLGRQPRAGHDFLVKYQDRVLFGKDAYEPLEYPYYWRVFETRDEYFDYYRDYHAFWKLYGLDLPDAVLKKIYFQNALKITPGLPQSGWPK